MRRRQHARVTLAYAKHIVHITGAVRDVRSPVDLPCEAIAERDTRGPLDDATCRRCHRRSGPYGEWRRCHSGRTGCVSCARGSRLRHAGPRPRRQLQQPRHQRRFLLRRGRRGAARNVGGRCGRGRRRHSLPPLATPAWCKTFYVNSANYVAKPISPEVTVTQESWRMPGVSEPGDRFGAAVQIGNGSSLWIEVPGESVRDVAAAGDVIRTRIASHGRLKPFGYVIRLGGGGPDNMPGRPQAGAHVGSALSTMAVSDEGIDFAGGEGVVVSAPGVAIRRHDQRRRDLGQQQRRPARSCQRRRLPRQRRPARPRGLRVPRRGGH